MFSEMYSVRDCNETLPREHMITGLGNSKARRLDVNGAGTRSRTRDLLITSQYYTPFINSLRGKYFHARVLLNA